MSYGVHIVCRPESALGFALAGVPADAVTSTEEGVRQLTRLAGEADAGVILVEEELYEALPEDLVREMGRRPLPMVVPFPGPAWEARSEGAEAYIVELLRQAIGYRVRLR